MDNRPIGIFDSGVGGLTVVKEVMDQLPNEQIIYFGDTARVPYGSKSKETITKYSRQIIKFLLEKDVKAVIIACGTASSNSLQAMRREFEALPIKGVVQPGAIAAVRTTQNNRIGIIGTEGTVRSGAYKKLIQEQNSAIQVYSKACPLFVPLAEEGWVTGDIAKQTAQIYLKELLEQDIDTLVLGCTHYPLLTCCIQEVVGVHVKLVNPATQTAAELKQLLEQKDMFRIDHCSPSHEFYVSDNSTKFEQLALSVLQKPYLAQKIDIDQY
jgi:glutamate racemase